MTEKRLIHLSWPPKALWQNRPSHWGQKAKAKASARHEAWALALEQNIGRWPTARLVFDFHPPCRRKRDLHNMPATQKAAIDGIADAMGCDDAGFVCVWPDEWGHVVKGGCVLVTITAGENWQSIGSVADRLVQQARKNT